MSILISSCHELHIAHGFTLMTPSPHGWEAFPTPERPLPIVGSLGPSHRRRHKSRVSLQGPLCAHGVLGIPYEEVRDIYGFQRSNALKANETSSKSVLWNSFMTFGDKDGKCNNPHYARIVVGVKMLDAPKDNSIQTKILCSFILHHERVEREQEKKMTIVQESHKVVSKKIFLWMVRSTRQI